MALELATITSDISRDGSNRPHRGLKPRILLIPGSELDPADTADVVLNSTYPNSLIDDIVPDAVAHLFEVAGNDKYFMRVNNTLVSDANNRPGFLHGISGIRIDDPDVTVRQQINNIITGGGIYYAVVERKWQGTDRDDAFLFFGYDHGLMVTEYEESDDIDGAIQFSLGTPPEAGSEEFLPRVYLKTDYATTKADVWTSKLA